MSEEIKNQLDDIGNLVDSKIEKAFGQAKDNAKGEVEASLKSEIDNLSKEYLSKHEAVVQRMDEVEMAYKKDMSNSKPLSFKGTLHKSIKEGALDGLRNGGASSARFEVKADDMTMNANLVETAGMIARETIIPDYKFQPERAVHMRQLVPTGSSDAQQIRYAKETEFDSASIAMKAEGATLGQSDFTLTSKTANMEKLGTFLRITEEMMNDTPQLTSYISARVPQKVLNLEDTQILTGSGASNQIDGFATTDNHTDYAVGGFANTISGANEYDVLVTALNQLALANYQADTILVNPTDLHKIALLKSSQNEYLRQQLYSGLQPQVMGINIVANSAVTSDAFYVANFQQASQFWIRENLAIEFAREDSTNFRDGFVTVRVQERVCQTIYLPSAVIYGDFSVAKANLDPDVTDE